MANYHIPLIPGGTVSYFSRAVGDESLFLEIA
jgi:hypothetical protein